MGGPLGSFRNKIKQNKYFTCAYCGTHVLSKKLSVDHIVPKSAGGTDQKTNLVAACKPCNTLKSSLPQCMFHVWLSSPEGLHWKVKRQKVAKGWMDRFHVWLQNQYMDTNHLI